jgi:hypothetical protein
VSNYIKKDKNGFYVFDEIEFLKTLPTGLEYFAVDKETEQVYNLGFNYKEKMEKQISDLETQLANLQQEQIAEMKEHQEAMELADNTINNLVEDNLASQEWYKKQLAKKEEQVQKSQEIYFETLKELDELEDNFNNTSLELWAEKLITQDKISFAVEQWEKVSQEFSMRVGITDNNMDLLNEIIDNQIKVIKGEK